MKLNKLKIGKLLIGTYLVGCSAGMLAFITVILILKLADIYFCWFMFGLIFSIGFALTILGFRELKQGMVKR